MRYLQAGFVGEGPTDAQYLVPLVRRMFEEHLIQFARSAFLVPDPLVIRPYGAWGNAPDDVIEELANEYSHLDVLIYHTDGGGEVSTAYAERVEAVVSGTSVSVIGVVPKREMEAWTLCDAQALCAVLGVDLTQVTVPHDFRPSRVESITDPKAQLNAFIKGVPGRHYRSPDPEASLLGALALTVDLNVLTRVPQAKKLAEDIATLAQRKHWLL